MKALSRTQSSPYGDWVATEATIGPRRSAACHAET